MDFTLTERQKQIVDDFTKFGREHFSTNRSRQWQDDQGLPDDVCKAFVDLYASYPELFPPRREEGSLLAMAIAVETIVHEAAVSLPFASDLINLAILSLYDSSPQVKAMFREYRHTGRLAYSLAVTEPDAGSDTVHMSTKVSRGPEGLVLNGRKTFVVNGEYAPNIMVAAIDDGDLFGDGGEAPDGADGARDAGTGGEGRDGADGARHRAADDDGLPSLSFWLIPADLPGISALPIDKIGQKSLPFADLAFENVPIKPEYRLTSTENTGFPQLFQMLEVGRVLTCAQSLGLAQAAMDDAVAHSARREAFGRPICHFQQIQQMLVDMQVKLDTMRSMVYRAGWEWDAGSDRCRLTVALMKRYVPAAATEVASDALQILGGRGYSQQERVSWIWQDCRGNQIAEGTDQIMVHIAAPLLMKLYGEDVGPGVFDD